MLKRLHSLKDCLRNLNTPKPFHSATSNKKGVQDKEDFPLVGRITLDRLPVEIRQEILLYVLYDDFNHGLFESYKGAVKVWLRCLEVQVRKLYLVGSKPLSNDVLSVLGHLRKLFTAKWATPHRMCTEYDLKSFEPTRRTITESEFEYLVANVTKISDAQLRASRVMLKLRVSGIEADLHRGPRGKDVRRFVDVAIPREQQRRARCVAVREILDIELARMEQVVKNMIDMDS